MHFPGAGPTPRSGFYLMPLDTSALDNSAYEPALDTDAQVFQQSKRDAEAGVWRVVDDPAFGSMRVEGYVAGARGVRAALRGEVVARGGVSLTEAFMARVRAVEGWVSLGGVLR
ncbi:MAG: hypothetical protein M1829_006009 [Trizodia sp. TS-e1964]|nr:MAG: hypothetical protein M1829_006009 [Trizodia sp. TS-e1964]